MNGVSRDVTSIRTGMVHSRREAWAPGSGCGSIAGSTSCCRTASGWVGAEKSGLEGVLLARESARRTNCAHLELLQEPLPMAVQRAGGQHRVQPEEHLHGEVVQLTRVLDAGDQRSQATLALVRHRTRPRHVQRAEDCAVANGERVEGEV